MILNVADKMAAQIQSTSRSTDGAEEGKQNRKTVEDGAGIYVTQIHISFNRHTVLRYINTATQLIHKCV